MKPILTILTLCAVLTLQAQQPYWQQQVDYNIRVALNDREHSLKGHESLVYTNHSPDTLSFIWFHLWPNAYKNETTALARQLQRDAAGKRTWKKLKEKGSMDSLSFSVDGVPARTEPHPDYIDITKLLLPHPLMPGASIRIETPFYVRIPTYISRSGRDGDNYYTCQWYPKPAVYDRKGWHPIPYLDMGEFYSEYGNYEVSVTLPARYIVGATGVLQNADELAQYREMGKQNVAAQARKNVGKYAAAAGNKTLSWKAEKVHDFAWFASPDFVVRYDTLQLSSGKTVDVFTYHHPDGNKAWIHSTDFVKSGARNYSQWIGEYEWPVVQAVEGPSNESAGGMEYPTITLITSPDADDQGLDGVITHEVGHNWFYGMLGTNERTHAWMDEGINTYFEFRYEAEKYRANSIFGSSLPLQIRTQPLEQFQALVYKGLDELELRYPIDTPSEDFKDDEQYGITEYVKTAIWMYLMELELGREPLDKAMQGYFRQWKFRHPYPEDMRAALEQQLQKDLVGFWDLLKKPGRL